MVTKFKILQYTLQNISEIDSHRPKFVDMFYADKLSKTFFTLH